MIKLSSKIQVDPSANPDYLVAKVFMKRASAFLSIFLLFASGSAKAEGENVPSVSRRLEAPMDVCLPSCHNILIRSGIFLEGPIVFQAASCVVSNVHINNDSISCDVDGRWTTAPSVFLGYTKNGFEIQRRTSAGEWKILCDQFRRWNNKPTMLTIRCPLWASFGGYVIFDNATSQFQFGSEKPELLFNPKFDNLVQRTIPPLVVSGRYGWKGSGPGRE